jgi:hypothetical protein
VAVRRLANPVTLCDDHGVVFFVTASGQIRMAADTERACRSLRHADTAARLVLEPSSKGYLLEMSPDRRQPPTTATSTNS